MGWMWSVREESTMTVVFFSSPKKLVEWKDGPLIWRKAEDGVGFVAATGDQEFSLDMSN